MPSGENVSRAPHGHGPISSALEKAGIPYAVIGGNAVAAWVARIEVHKSGVFAVRRDRRVFHLSREREPGDPQAFKGRPPGEWPIVHKSNSIQAENDGYET